MLSADNFRIPMSMLSLTGVTCLRKALNVPRCAHDVADMDMHAVELIVR
jgi:hypothetical protein